MPTVALVLGSYLSRVYLDKIFVLPTLELPEDR